MNYKDQVSDEAIEKRALKLHPVLIAGDNGEDVSLSERQAFTKGLKKCRSILLPILEEKDAEIKRLREFEIVQNLRAGNFTRMSNDNPA